MRHSAVRWLALIALASAPTIAWASPPLVTAPDSSDTRHPAATDSAQQAQPAAKQAEMRVSAVWDSPGAPADSDHVAAAGIRDNIYVRVDGLGQNVDSAAVEWRKAVLYLDHREIRGLHPTRFDRTRETLQFKLTRAAGSDSAWADVIGSPRTKSKSVVVGVGFGQSELLPVNPQDPPTLSLVIFTVWRIRVALAGFVAALLLFWWMLRKSDILRDAPVDPADPDPKPTTENPNPRRPYSLARTQAAFWFFIITGAFVFLYMLLGVYDTLTTQALALLGIGSATTLAAVFIDDNRRDADKARAALAGKALPQRASEDFLRDVLTAEDGVSLHRFQMLVWTLVLGWIFCDGVWRNLSMPEFSSNLIALMGLSSFTYLGFKITEKPESGADSAKADGAAKEPPAEQPVNQPAAAGPAGTAGGEGKLGGIQIGPAPADAGKAEPQTPAPTPT